MTKTIHLLLISTIFIFLSINISAHGYVVSPAARGYQGSLEKNTLGYSAATQKYGAVIYEPQSLEAPKGFPGGGPADGRIASANGTLGDTVLDNQTADRWTKTNISKGVNPFIWKYTAYHKTSKWHYYMTKQGWNPNKPITRNDLELIGEVTHNNTPPKDNTPHYISIPQNREGYHVIVAIWDVADTSNAFYNVIDVNVTGGANLSKASSNELLPQPKINSKSVVENKTDNHLSIIVKDQTMSLYPENNLKNINKIIVFDTRGVLKLSLNDLQQNSIDISTLQTGLYYIKIFYSDGRSIVKAIHKS